MFFSLHIISSTCISHIHIYIFYILLSLPFFLPLFIYISIYCHIYVQSTSRLSSSLCMWW